MATGSALHVSTHPEQYSCLEAKGPLLDKVFSLRYQCYNQKGYIADNNSGLFLDEYDNRKHVKSYLAYKNKEVIGSIRVCGYCPEEKTGIPALEMYEEELAENIGLGSRIVEANRFVIKPSFQNKIAVDARFTIFKSVVDFALSFGAKAIVIAVRREHANFYRLLKCYPISDFKKYHGVSFETVLLSCVDIEKAKKIIGRILKHDKVLKTKIVKNDAVENSSN